MSLVVGWVGVDTHGIASAYLASDSRISLTNGKHFDYARKVFASQKYPEIFGFSGKALFPSIILTQIIELIDNGLLLDDDMDTKAKNGIVFAKIKELYDEYGIKDIDNSRVEIVHFTKSTHGKNPSFNCYHLLLDGDKKVRNQEIELPKRSGVVIILGSGFNGFRSKYTHQYQKSKNMNTSRNVFHCFINELLFPSTATVGGPPQLVGIMRKPDSHALIYGLIYKRKRYIAGLPYTKLKNIQSVQWRNMYFELCNPKTKEKEEGAADQPNFVTDFSATP